MNLHIVNVKCTILSVNKHGEDVAKPTTTSLAIYNAGTFGNAEIETAKYFEKKASPENAHRVTKISENLIHSVMYAITPAVAEEDEIEALWFKIKVELQGEGKPFSNTYLVFAETMQKAQEFVKNSFSHTTLDVIFKTSAQIKLMDYIELEGPKKEAAAPGMFTPEEEMEEEETTEDDFETEEKPEEKPVDEDDF